MELRAVDPYNVEAESALLGSCLIDPRAIDRIASLLQPDEFYLPANRQIYEAMIVLQQMGRKTDVVTVSEVLTRSGLLEQSGGVGYLVSLANDVPTAFNAEYYAAIISDLSASRRAIAHGQRVMEMGSKSLPPETLYEQIENDLFENVVRIARTGGYRATAESIPDIRQKWDEARLHSGFVGLTMGLADLDNVLEGLEDEELIYLAGRPGSGKTMVALNVARHVAIELREPVYFVSLEMSEEQLIERLVSMLTRIDSKRLRNKSELTLPEWAMVQDALRVIEAAPLHIDSTIGITPMEMRMRTRRRALITPPRLIILDYVQLLIEGKKGPEHEEVSAISKGLKTLAREMRCPLLSLAQLNRKADERTDHEPRLSDLRASGSLEQDADKVLATYDDTMYNPNSDLGGMLKLLVLKNRNGENGKEIFLRWDKATHSVSSLIPTNMEF